MRSKFSNWGVLVETRVLIFLGFSLHGLDFFRLKLGGFFLGFDFMDSFIKLGFLFLNWKRCLD